jgi:hypothetical protein
MKAEVPSPAALRQTAQRFKEEALRMPDGEARQRTIRLAQECDALAAALEREPALTRATKRSD